MSHSQTVGIAQPCQWDEGPRPNAHAVTAGVLLTLDTALGEPIKGCVRRAFWVGLGPSSEGVGQFSSFAEEKSAHTVNSAGHSGKRGCPMIQAAGLDFYEHEFNR